MIGKTLRTVLCLYAATTLWHIIYVDCSSPGRYHKLQPWRAPSSLTGHDAIMDNAPIDGPQFQANDSTVHIQLFYRPLRSRISFAAAIDIHFDRPNLFLSFCSSSISTPSLTVTHSTLYVSCSSCWTKEVLGSPLRKMCRFQSTYWQRQSSIPRGNRRNGRSPFHTMIVYRAILLQHQAKRIQAALVGLPVSLQCELQDLFLSVRLGHSATRQHCKV